MTDYEINLPMAIRTHKGTVFQAFNREMRETRTQVQQSGIGRNWWAYEGRQAGAFVAYTRFQPRRLTIAVIAGKAEKEGRMPIICTAAERLAYEAELTLRFESILHYGLRDCLLARGYRYADGNPSSYPDLIFNPRQP
jgi:hypothetical protein